MRTKTKLGIYVDTIEFSQLFLCLNHEAELAGDRLNITLFFNNGGKFIDSPYYTIMPAYNIWKANFPIIATDRLSAMYLSNAYPIKNKYFYLWDIEELDTNKQYKNYINMKLLTRNKETFNIIKDSWKEPIGIIDDFDYRELLKIAR